MPTFLLGVSQRAGALAQISVLETRRELPKRLNGDATGFSAASVTGAAIVFCQATGETWMGDPNTAALKTTLISFAPA